MRKPFVGIVVALFAILLVGVAVVQGQGASTPTAAATPASCASPVASPMAAEASPTTTTAVGIPAPCASPVAAAAGATVALEDIRFDPRTLTLTANTDGVITITNNGAAVHNFNIDALNIHSGDVQPGATTTVKVNAAAGDYTYYCSIPGHEAAGMVGVLTIK